MWWRSPLAAALLLALAACGFRPLYGSRSADPNLRQDLASIHIVPLAERQGQLIHNALLARINPDGEPRHPRYDLEVSVAAADSQEALQTDNTATRDVTTYSIRYTLREGQSPVTQGSFVRIFSYDYLQQQYSNITAAADTQRRAADQIADEMVDRMAAYFTRSAQMRAQQGLAQPANP